MSTDETWMQRAYELAQKAEAEGEVPVGAVVVYQDKIIGEGWNQPIISHDPTAHAEIMALRDAANNIGNYRLPDTSIYVTLEPCPMCAGAIVHARVKHLHYAVEDPRSGAAGSCLNLLQLPFLNHKTTISSGLYADKSKSLLQNFFRKKRENKNAS